MEIGQQKQIFIKTGKTIKRTFFYFLAISQNFLMFSQRIFKLHKSSSKFSNILQNIFKNLSKILIFLAEIN